MFIGRTRFANRGPLFIVRLVLTFTGMGFLMAGGPLVSFSFSCLNSGSGGICPLKIVGGVFIAIGLSLFFAGFAVACYAATKARQQANIVTYYGGNQVVQLGGPMTGVPMGGAMDGYSNGGFSVPVGAPPPYGAPPPFPGATQHYGTQYSSPIMQPPPMSTAQPTLITY